jgi:hypothetical protein
VKWLHDLLTRPSRRPAAYPSLPESLTEPLELSALADLERKLDVLTGGGSPQTRIGKRAEAEVQRFFGGEALRGMQCAASTSENGTIVFAADRLLVTFLGRSAAMAITRKLYSDPK